MRWKNLRHPVVASFVGGAVLLLIQAIVGVVYPLMWFAGWEVKSIIAFVFGIVISYWVFRGCDESKAPRIWTFVLTLVCFFVTTGVSALSPGLINHVRVMIAKSNKEVEAAAQQSDDSKATSEEVKSEISVPGIPPPVEQTNEPTPLRRDIKYMEYSSLSRVALGRVGILWAVGTSSASGYPADNPLEIVIEPLAGYRVVTARLLEITPESAKDPFSTCCAGPVRYQTFRAVPDYDWQNVSPRPETNALLFRLPAPPNGFPVGRMQLEIVYESVDSEGKRLGEYRLTGNLRFSRTYVDEVIQFPQSASTGGSDGQVAVFGSGTHFEFKALGFGASERAFGFRLRIDPRSNPSPSSTISMGRLDINMKSEGKDLELSFSIDSEPLKQLNGDAYIYTFENHSEAAEIWIHLEHRQISVSEDRVRALNAPPMRERDQDGPPVGPAQFPEGVLSDDLLMTRDRTRGPDSAKPIRIKFGGTGSWQIVYLEDSPLVFDEESSSELFGMQVAKRSPKPPRHQLTRPPAAASAQPTKVETVEAEHGKKDEEMRDTESTKRLGKLRSPL